MTEQRELRDLPTAQLRAAPYHHRTDWGDMQGLANSVRAQTVIEPLVVRPLTDGLFEVVCGERRRRAADMVGLLAVPCVIAEIDLERAILWQYDENSKRHGLHPMDEAAYCADLAELGYDFDAIAIRLGLNRRIVMRRLKLMSLVPQARAAFQKGRIDEDGAFALARVDDPGKQVDVIAAVESGHMQAEEIAGYVAREFTASLEAVPWRVSDAGLIAEAGACTECPKQTGIQRDLFDDMRGTRCLDVTCYRQKMDAVYAKHAETYPHKFELDGPNLFIPQAGGVPVVMKASGMVDADAPCPYMIGNTWRDAVRLAADPESPPTEYLTRDQDGRPRFVFRESIVTRIVRKSDGAQAQAQAEADADPLRPETTPRAEAKVRKAIVDQLATKVADGDHDVWGWIAARIVDHATARVVAAACTQFADALAEAGGTEGKPGLLGLVAQSNRWAKRVAAAIVIRETADVIDAIPDSLRELAKICGVDLRAIERGVRKDRA